MLSDWWIRFWCSDCCPHSHGKRMRKQWQTIEIERVGLHLFGNGEFTICEWSWEQLVLHSFAIENVTNYLKTNAVAPCSCNNVMSRIAERRKHRKPNPYAATSAVTKLGPFYKILREDLTHHGFSYQPGLNVETKPFEPCTRCFGGLYFSA